MIPMTAKLIRCKTLAAMWRDATGATCPAWCASAGNAVSRVTPARKQILKKIFIFHSPVKETNNFGQVSDVWVTVIHQLKGKHHIRHSTSTFCVNRLSMEIIFIRKIKIYVNLVCFRGYDRNIPHLPRISCVCRVRLSNSALSFSIAVPVYRIAGWILE